MGKKNKIGKQRRDKFYHLAKETGYRSRAAFKLLQLNRKHEFLQKSRVCVDLCAAPGGWLQVAAQYMPVSSVIVGVDLVPIKPIRNVVTIQEDITSEKCRQLLKKELQTWKADLVLNDGAPNLGQNWLQDAFLQAQLTLSALKLASEFLNKGGWFVTKVFRSKDYNSLLWVFKQLFKKVYATKPQASRTESAEIFVVCQHYLAPDKIDPKFLDPKYAFADFDSEPASAKSDILHPEKQSKKALGYRDGDHTLFHSVNVSEFVSKGNYIELLNDCSELVFDDDAIAQHELTTSEIKECCKDIKVLGKKELKVLLSWRKKIRNSLDLNEKLKEKKVEEVDKEDEDEDEEKRIEREILDRQLEEAKNLKLKKKKVLKERRKLREKMNLKMVLPNDEPVVDCDDAVFSLKTILDKNQLKYVEENNLNTVDEFVDDGHDLRRKDPKYRIISYDRSDHVPNDWDDDFCGSETSESEDQHHEGLASLKEREEEEEEENDSECELVGRLGDENPLVVDLDYSTPTERTQRKVDMWFAKDSFAGLENDDDDDFETDLLAKRLQQKGLVNGETKENSSDDRTTSGDDSTDSDSDVSDFDVDEAYSNKSYKPTKEAIHNAKRDGFETVPARMSAKKRKLTSLDPEGLALGGLMIKSQKTKRDILDLAWNRTTNNDDDLPDWFLKEERQHSRPNLPVTKEMVAEYRSRLHEINARPIKKVIEAKARKKRRSLKKMEKARKRATHVVDSMDMTDKEKSQQIKAIYKKAGVGDKPKKELAYVVSKKGLVGKRVRRPPGVKGRFRVVDPRQKKDDRSRKSMEKMSKKKRMPKAKINKLKKKLANNARKRTKQS